ncbi:MAG TPA: HAD-IIIA family hydrolase [Pyrinomonadaceae bacterium]|jgi:3-deoxy-D-manno-octulosonate 8-phosphate phosphatase (KDO 8-P phosphatase)
MKLETRNSKLETDEILRRARRIKLLLMDCDGVLTDGRIWLTADGDEQKAFHVRDGQGIKLLHGAGVKTGIISGRSSPATERRAHELGITYVRQGADDKLQIIEEILSAAGVDSDQCAYVGDDLADVALMQSVGLAVAVADAAEDAKKAAHYVTENAGGHGAVREVCDLILASMSAAS